MDDNSSVNARSTGLRIGGSILAGVVLLLVIAAVVRPAMLMDMVHTVMNDMGLG